MCPGLNVSTLIKDVQTYQKCLKTKFSKLAKHSPHLELSMHYAFDACTEEHKIRYTDILPFCAIHSSLLGDWSLPDVTKTELKSRLKELYDIHCDYLSHLLCTKHQDHPDTVCYHKSRSNSIGQDMLALPWALQSRTQKVWAPAVEMLFLRPAGSLPAILIRKCSFVLSLIINCTVIDLHLVTSFKQQKQMLVVQFWTTCNMLWIWFKKVDLKTNKFPQALVWQWFVERLWQREI